MTDAISPHKGNGGSEMIEAVKKEFGLSDTSYATLGMYGARIFNRLCAGEAFDQVVYEVGYQCIADDKRAPPLTAFETQMFERWEHEQKKKRAAERQLGRMHRNEEAS